MTSFDFRVSVPSEGDFPEPSRSKRVSHGDDWDRRLSPLTKGSYYPMYHLSTSCDNVDKCKDSLAGASHISQSIAKHLGDALTSILAFNGPCNSWNPGQPSLIEAMAHKS